MYNNNRQNATANRSGKNAAGNPFLDALEKLKDEYTTLSTQLTQQRSELEKIAAEKEQMQRHYMMYYEMSCSLNLEMQKQSEISKRYHAILTEMIRHVPQDQATIALSAVERAKQVSMPDLQALTAASQQQQLSMMMGGMAGPMMGALPGGITPAAIAAMANLAGMRPAGDGGAQRQSTSRQRSNSPGTSVADKRPKLEDDGDLEIDVQNDDPNPTTTGAGGSVLSNGKTGRDSAHSGVSSSGASTPARGRHPLAPMDPHQTARLAASMAMGSAKQPYSFRLEAGGGLVQTPFPADALTDPEVPKSVKALYELPHGEVVCAVTMASDTRRVYTGGKGCVKIWDSSNNGQELNRLECLAENYIRSCKLFNDDTHLAVGGEDGKIALFDIETSTKIAELGLDSQACYALALNHELRQLYACCADGNVLIFDLTTMEKIGELQGHAEGASCVDISKDGNRLFTGGLDSKVRIWDLRERRQMGAPTEHNSQVFSLGCSPSEEWLAVGLENNNVVVMSTQPAAAERYQLHRHDSCVLSLKYSNSGKWFCTTGKDNVLNMWRSPYGALAVRTTEVTSILSCDISKDDQFLVTGSGEKKATVYQVMYDNTNGN